jgi:hypothetical protein
MICNQLERKYFSGNWFSVSRKEVGRSVGRPSMISMRDCDLQMLVFSRRARNGWDVTQQYSGGKVEKLLGVSFEEKSLHP